MRERSGEAVRCLIEAMDNSRDRMLLFQYYIEERDKAQVALRNEVVNLSMEIAGKVIREELTASKHKRLVDEFLAEVEQVK